MADLTLQQKFEVIKALAYGEPPEQIAAAEGIDVGEVRKIQKDDTAEIAEEQQELKKAGYLV